MRISRRMNSSRGWSPNGASPPIASCRSSAILPCSPKALWSGCLNCSASKTTSFLIPLTAPAPQRSLPKKQGVAISGSIFRRSIATLRKRELRMLLPRSDSFLFFIQPKKAPGFPPRAFSFAGYVIPSMRASMVLGECRSSCLNSYSGAKVEKNVPSALFLTVPSGK